MQGSVWAVCISISPYSQEEGQCELKGHVLFPHVCCFIKAFLSPEWEGESPVLQSNDTLNFFHSSLCMKSLPWAKLAPKLYDWHTVAPSDLLPLHGDCSLRLDKQHWQKSWLLFENVNTFLMEKSVLTRFISHVSFHSPVCHSFWGLYYTKGHLNLQNKLITSENQSMPIFPSSGSWTF